MPDRPRPRTTRKLLVATLGVATVSFVGCDGLTSGNLMPPPPCDDAGHHQCFPDASPDAGVRTDAGQTDPADASASDAPAGDR